MKVGVAYRQDASGDPGVTAEAMVTEAMQQLDGGAPAFVLAFHGAGVNADSWTNGIRTGVGPEPLITGGSSIGVLTNLGLDYNGNAAALAVFADLPGGIRSAVSDRLDEHPEQVGRELAEQLGAPGAEQTTLLFYSSVKAPATESSPWILNSSAPLLKGLIGEPDQDPHVVGAGLLSSLNFDKTQLFHNERQGEQLATAVRLPPGLNCVSRIMHGCEPLDGVYHTITRMEEDRIYEVDGRPIIEVMNELYGSTEWQQQRPVVNRLTIGVNLGSRFGETNEDAYVNRLITGVLPDGEGIGVFETDLTEGTEVLFMLRDTSTIVKKTKIVAHELMEEVDASGDTPVFALYIDCAGRTLAISNTLSEEGQEVVSLMAERGIPMIGTYSGVEVAPVRGQVRGLDWTGVLTVWTTTNS